MERDTPTAWVFPRAVFGPSPFPDNACYFPYNALPLTTQERAPDRDVCIPGIQINDAAFAMSSVISAITLAAAARSPQLHASCCTKRKKPTCQEYEVA